MGSAIDLATGPVPVDLEPDVSVTAAIERTGWLQTVLAVQPGDALAYGARCYNPVVAHTVVVEWARVPDATFYFAGL